MNEDSITSFKNNENYVGISKFDVMNDLPDRPFSVIVNGMTAAGKGVMVQKLLADIYNKLKIKHKEMYLFSSTALIQPDMFKFIKKRYTTYEPSKIIKIMEKQEKIFLKGYKNGESKENLIFKHRKLIILDDMAFGNRGGGGYGFRGFSQSDAVLERLFISNRHLALDVILIVQKISSVISPKMRTNASIVILYPTINVKQQDMLISEFGFKSFFDSKQSKAIVNNLFSSKDYLCIVCLNHVKNKRTYKDLLRWHVADITNLDKETSKIKLMDKKKNIYRDETDSDEDPDEDDNIFRKIKDYKNL